MRRMIRTAHLADDAKPLTTLCGEPWEAWQDPDMPTDDEIGLKNLPYALRVAVRQEDEQRRAQLQTPVRQCQSCLKWATKRDRPVDRSSELIADVTVLVAAVRELIRVGGELARGFGDHYVLPPAAVIEWHELINDPHLRKLIEREEED